MRENERQDVLIEQLINNDRKKLKPTGRDFVTPQTESKIFIF